MCARDGVWEPGGKRDFCVLHDAVDAGPTDAPQAFRKRVVDVGGGNALTRETVDCPVLIVIRPCRLSKRHLGRTWSNGEFSNAKLRVRLTMVAASTSREFRLDWAAVQVTYTP